MLTHPVELMQRAAGTTVPVILGPTASGKSALAFEFALATGAEIISADSRQIYRGMDIGTAKPSKEMLRKVRHHFIDEKEIGEPFSAGDFAVEARTRILSIHEHGGKAVVAGGSTLYLEGLLHGFAELPAANPEIRARLQHELEHNGAETLYLRLAAIDPEQARTLDPTKTQRLVRSLEIIELTGRTVTALQRAAKADTGESENGALTFHLYGLDMPRAKLYDSINKRVTAMMQEGLLDEVRKIRENYILLLRKGRINALETVGYKELFNHLEGRFTLDEAVGLIQQHTRNYAKRQLTFFRNRLPRIEWLDAPPDAPARAALADKIIIQVL